MVDASADPTVDSGSATYVYSTAQSVWIKIAEAESMDVVLDWALIQNKPTAAVGAIDAAAAFVSANSAALTTLLAWFTTAQADVDAAAAWVTANGVNVLTELSGLSTDVATHSSHLTTLDGQISALQLADTNLGDRLTAVENANTTQDTTLAGHTSTLTNHGERLTTLEAASLVSATFQGKFSEDAQGRLLYNGDYPTARLAVAEW